MAHHNCQYADESGWSLVEVVTGFCEVGTKCVKSCPYSWQDKKTEKNADRAFENYIKNRSRNESR